jgi:hypothetical protein
MATGLVKYRMYTVGLMIKASQVLKKISFHRIFQMLVK